MYREANTIVGPTVILCLPKATSVIYRSIKEPELSTLSSSGDNSKLVNNSHQGGWDDPTLHAALLQNI